ncbi:MAG: T9SS type A sorting domain-containing protein [Taibaiella sp.]|nr:T9SS type A sorting domain-containing protein [Taibaiella sp.]
MKKLFTLIAFIAISFGANAQRIVDLGTTMVNPTTGTAIDSSVAFATNIVITNHGPAQFKATDTLFYYYTVGGHALQLGATAADTIGGYTNLKVLNTNDTLQLNYNFGIRFHVTATSTSSYCFVIYSVQNRSADSAKDNNANNNAGCATLTFKTTGISTLSFESSDVTLYPNPAQSKVNFDITLAQGNTVNIKVMDMIGRTVVSQNEGRLDAGKHTINMNTASLPNGVYIYQVLVGEETKTGRFNIAK